MKGGNREVHSPGPRIEEETAAKDAYSENLRFRNAIEYSADECLTQLQSPTGGFPGAEEKRSQDRYGTAGERAAVQNADDELCARRVLEAIEAAYITHSQTSSLIVRAPTSQPLDNQVSTSPRTQC